jgi:hypothetical protein
VATVEDYRAVRELVLDLFDVAVQATVSETVRETVVAVADLAPLQPTTLGAVSKRLRLDKGTVSRRLKVAIAEGYVLNKETSKGQPMQLVCGDPLPESLPLLPDPADLDACCTVAVLHGGLNIPSPPAEDLNHADEQYYGGA